MLKFLIVPILMFSTQLSVAEDKQSSAEIESLLKNKIRIVQHMALNLSMVSAVKKQNAQGLSLDEIKTRDNAWKQTKKLTTLKRRLLQNKAGQFLQLKIDSDSGFNEAFLTDNQGANVAAYPPTSDYWQGDEDKWSKSFNEGQGQLYIGPVELDESTNTKAAQVSVPVYDHGKTIGVLVVGVAVDALAPEKK